MKSAPDNLPPDAALPPLPFALHTRQRASSEDAQTIAAASAVSKATTPLPNELPSRPALAATSSWRLLAVDLAAGAWLLGTLIGAGRVVRRLSRLAALPPHVGNTCARSARAGCAGSGGGIRKGAAAADSRFPAGAGAALARSAASAHRAAELLGRAVRCRTTTGDPDPRDGPHCSSSSLDRLGAMAGRRFVLVEPALARGQSRHFAASRRNLRRPRAAIALRRPRVRPCSGRSGRALN